MIILMQRHTRNLHDPADTIKAGLQTKYDFTLKKGNVKWLIGGILTDASEDAAARDRGYSCP